MVNEAERAAFRDAAYPALGTRELIEYLNQRTLSGETVSPASVDRAQSALQPVAKVLYDVFQRTGHYPRLRYRGYLFLIAINPGNVLDFQVIRESDIETVE
jgi:hypothetical protein